MNSPLMLPTQNCTRTLNYLAVILIYLVMTLHRLKQDSIAVVPQSLIKRHYRLKYKFLLWRSLLCEYTNRWQ